MARYVLVHRGKEPSQEDLDLISMAKGAVIIDETLKRAMLIEAPEETVNKLRSKLPNWIIADEVTHSLPGPHQQSVRRDPPA